MATKYCDQGLYPAYAASPTFGTCQEGDGTAIGIATSASVSIDLTGMTAAAGNTFTVGGAVLTCVASGAAANQFNAAASASALATALASAINAATNAIVVTGGSNPLLGWRAAQLRDVCYATASGNTLNIQTRAGSEAYNATSFFAAVSSGFTGGSVNAQFSGGAGGAWGYFINNATIWPSGAAAGAYGVFCGTQPIAGVASGGDVIKVRSANRTINFTANATYTIATAAMGSRTAPVTFDIDDGTAWPADGANPTLTFAVSAAVNGQGFVIQPASAAYFHLRAKKSAAGVRNLRFQVTPTNTMSTQNIAVYFGPPYRMDNVDFLGLLNGTFAARAILTNTSGSVAPMASLRTQLYGCRWTWGDTTGAAVSPINTTANSTFAVDLYSPEFDVGAGSVSAINLLGMSITGTMSFNMYSPKFTNFPVGSKLKASASIGTSSVFQVNIFSPILGGITDFRPAFSQNGGTVAPGGEYGAQGVYMYSRAGGRDFLIDTSAGFCSWISTASYPYNNARLLDGTTGWSMRLIPSTSTGVNQTMSPATPFKGMPFSKINSIGTDGARTINFEFAIEKTLAATYTKRDFSFLIEYEDATTGAREVFSTYDPDGAALSSSATVWQSGDVVDPADSVRRLALVESGTTYYHSKFAMSITTPTAVKAGSEITVWPCSHSVTTGVSVGIIIDPEFSVT